ncbi:M20/M25/M40 family metallo-hydrolase [Brevundimonas sp. M20]|uniref:M20/M25/M40 family metallo-hydrolase n=1 Tax=Brevundimonas sp. M20 TaxID=2591463 RepID=UPI0011466BAC|nr:M20/M25/M40 family metallo-hydrolase [Brevundimonas sp. M20]QDH74360.1 M20/M25/M40 family metallo-hydrolase [Brevundimonas sp. M20]
MIGTTGKMLAALATTALLAGSVAAQTDNARPDQAAFRDLYRELIETNTTLSEGSCTLASERMAARLLAAGYPAADVRVLVPSERPKDGNLAAVLRGDDPTAAPILLLAHIDVVEARREDWTRDPFTLIEEDGYFHARGAQDDKAQAAIWVDTLIRLKAEGFTPRRDIKIALTCGEETSDTFNGVSWLLANHRDALEAGFALNEGARGRLDAAGNRVALEIQAGEKIYQDYRLEITNPGGHSSRPVPDNAIYRLSNALTRLEAFTFPTEPNETVKAYFAALAPTNLAHAADMRAIGSASGRAREAAARRLSAADPAWNAVLRTTCVATMVDAGHAPNALPQRATANVNCRILPGQDPQAIRSRLARVLADPGIAVSIAGNIDPTSPPPPLSPDILEPIRAAAAELWPGVPVIPSMSPGATDGRFTNAAGVPTYGVTGLFADPDGGGVHGLNERIRVRSLYEGRDFLFTLVKAYAGQAQ